MKFVIAGTVLAIACLGRPLPSYSQVLLSPVESRAYHACLFAAYIDDYCRENSGRLDAHWGRVYSACVAANGGGRFPLDGRTWYNTDDYCWSRAQAQVH
jgi:hypothetical protein